MEQRTKLRHNRNFSIYYLGVLLSEVGARGTIAITLYHVYLLTSSTAMVGLVGLSQAVALVILSPLGGAIADRLDRVRVVQISQSLSLLVSAALAAVTLLGAVEPWHIYLAVALNTTASTFDGPARQALLPALVRREHLVRAYALVNPSREIAMLLGPALGGLFVAVWGPALMYLVDAASYLVLVAALAMIRVERPPRPETHPGLLRSLQEGWRFVLTRPIILQLVGLDVVATLFGAYRVVLPALAEDILDVGATGYGVLMAMPPAGALIASVLMGRWVRRWHGGNIVIVSTIAYGVACILLVQSPVLVVALLAAIVAGGSDAAATVIRHAAVQLETPDELRGRISGFYQTASRGSPALGEANIGWFAGLVGPVTALTVGAVAPIVVATTIWHRRTAVRGYTTNAS